MAQTITIILTASAEVNTNWKEYSSSQFVLFTGHGPSTTTNTSIFARVSCFIRWNNSTDRFEIKDIQLQYKKSNTVHSTPIIITMGGAMTFTNYYTKNSSMYPTKNASFMLSQIPEDSWKIIKTFISSGYAEINKNTKATCSISGLQASINGFSGGTKTIDLPIEIRVETPKTTVTYTFLGNGGTIAGESAVIKTGVDSIHIPVAARGKSNSKGSGSYKVIFNPNNGSSSSTVNCPYTTTITWISEKYSRVDNSSITVDAETSYKVPDKTDRTWNAVWQVGNETKDGPAKLTLPGNPTWFGHDFNGWYKDETNKLSSGMPVTEPFTAVAHWIKQQYNITFNLNNNYSPKWISGATTSIKKTYSESINLSDQFPHEPVAFGFKFIGWGTKDKVIYNGYNTKIDDNIVNSQRKISNIVLYAHWEPLNDNVVTHYYDLNNRLVTNTYHYNILTIDSNNKQRFVVPEPADRGVDWVFLGWYMPKNYKSLSLPKPWTSKPMSINNEVFWGNTSVATSMGSADFAYGVFRNPDDVDDKTAGTTLSPIEIVPFSSGGGDKFKPYTDWQKLSGQTDNVEYNSINSTAWNWTWEFYGFWTITGKYIATSKDKDGNITWSKVKAAYVLVPKTGELSDKDLEWKYVKEVYTCVRMNGLTPIWKREVWK